MFGGIEVYENLRKRNVEELMQLFGDLDIFRLLGWVGWIGLVVLTEWRVQETIVRYLAVISGKSTKRKTKKQMVNCG